VFGKPVKIRRGPATVRGVVFPGNHCPKRMGRFRELDAPSQDIGLEKFSDASSGIRSGEPS